MKCQTAHYFAAIAVLLAIASPAPGGVFEGSEDLMTNLVVHPPGFEGDGGQLTVTVCIQPGGEIIRPSVDDAIELWNGLVPTVENCPGCITSETYVGLPPGQVPPIFSLLRTATHELGHCGLGLGHTNWDVTSSSSAKDATAIRRCNTTPPCPPESIAGDTDDFALPNPPAIPAARIIHWFKDDPARPENTNNPFVIDDTVIDGSTFTRRRIDLPSGHTWPANANADSAEVFGFTDTQATMYSSVFGGEAFHRQFSTSVSNRSVALSRSRSTRRSSGGSLRPVFTDGFESGDTSGWSMTVP